MAARRIAPKLRTFSVRQLVEQLDPEARNRLVTEYRFSNGREAKRLIPQNRTA